MIASAAGTRSADSSASPARRPARKCRSAAVTRSPSCAAWTGSLTRAVCRPDRRVPGRVLSGLATLNPMGATIRNRLACGQRTFSFEFFPPKTDEDERILWQTIRQLEPLSPTFVSVTYGAGGATRDRTVEVTERIATDTTLLPMAHLTAVNHSVRELRHIVGRFAAAGIVSVTRYFVAKCRAGADFAIPQMFFEAEDYLRLRDRVAAEGCDVPIIPGIMPVVRMATIERSEQLSGAPFPAGLAAQFGAVAEDPKAVRALGIEQASRLCQRLLDEGAPGIHFITFNRSRVTREVWSNLRLSARV